MSDERQAFDARVKRWLEETNRGPIGTADCENCPLDDDEIWAALYVILRHHGFIGWEEPLVSDLASLVETECEATRDSVSAGYEYGLMKGDG